MRAAVYARVSTVNMGQDPTMQTRELVEYCQRRGWDIVGEYVDRGVSGAKDSRPELNRMMADAQRRRFDAVLVWKFDRFARSVSHLLRALETFHSLGVEFVSLSEQVDTFTPTGKMILTVLGAVAELERSLIVERVRAGMRNARAKGKRINTRLKRLRRSDNTRSAEAKQLDDGIGDTLVASARRAAFTCVDDRAAGRALIFR
jgi:DNA invertase Pin-like site-specific DNA recombinase